MRKTQALRFLEGVNRPCSPFSYSAVHRYMHRSSTHMPDSFPEIHPIPHDLLLAATAVIQRTENRREFPVLPMILDFPGLDGSNVGNTGTPIGTRSCFVRALRSLILLYICVPVQYLPSD